MGPLVFFVLLQVTFLPHIFIHVLPVITIDPSLDWYGSSPTKLILPLGRQDPLKSLLSRLSRKWLLQRCHPFCKPYFLFSSPLWWTAFFFFFFSSSCSLMATMITEIPPMQSSFIIGSPISLRRCRGSPSVLLLFLIAKWQSLIYPKEYAYSFIWLQAYKRRVQFRLGHQQLMIIMQKVLFNNSN